MFQNPIGVLTTNTGDPVDIREAFLINTNLFSSDYFYDIFTLHSGERIPQRHVHAKGIAVRGYFEVTNDVSKYTKADVFNGIGKRTPIRSRFSNANQERGGTDVNSELRGFATKFFTNEGIFDLLTLQVPVFFTKQPVDFISVVHAISMRNPKTHLFDFEMMWDLVTFRPSLLHPLLWIYSDYGIPDGFRKVDFFAGHTFELYNKRGEKYYAKFNFRTEQGLGFLTASEAAAIQAKDLDYAVRDMYNAIMEKKYPAWRLEMDVLTIDDIKQVDFDPFDLTQLWKNGTYRTVPIGRVVFDEMPDNQFRESEQSVFNPASLVPGIPGPVDVIFHARRMAYRDAHNYRLGRNHLKIIVNRPKYAKTYNRDGFPPVEDNMKDAPFYFPNSFSGPVPYVDESKPKELLIVRHDNAVDLQQPAEFYNKILTNDGQRQRLAENLVRTLQQVKSPLVLKRILKLFYLTDSDLGMRVETTYNAASSCRA